MVFPDDTKLAYSLVPSNGFARNDKAMTNEIDTLWEKKIRNGNELTHADYIQKKTLPGKRHRAHINLNLS